MTKDSLYRIIFYIICRKQIIKGRSLLFTDSTPFQKMYAKKAYGLSWRKAVCPFVFKGLERVCAHLFCERIF